MLPCLQVTYDQQQIVHPEQKRGTTDHGWQGKTGTLRNRAFLALIGATTILVAASAVYIAVSTPGLPEKIIMHFDGDQGITSFGTPSYLWWAWGMVVAGIAIDVALASFLFHRDRVLSYMLARPAPVVGLLLLIAVGTIISVN